MSFKTSFRQTTILTAMCFSVLAGLMLARSNYSLSYLWLLPVFIICLASFRQKNIVTLTGFLLLGLIFGLTRGGQFDGQLSPYDGLYGQSVKVRAKTLTDGVYAKNGQLDFDVGSLEILEPQYLKLPGNLKIQGYGTPAIYRGDIVEVYGKLFPTGGARQAKITYSQLTVIGRSGHYSEKVRREFVAGMQTALPEPQASFGLGLLVGQRNTLPDDVTQQLAIVGLTHIIAVSGYNLTIIIRGVRRGLSKISKYQSTITSLSLIGAFLLLTGFSASIVRAAIVSVLSLSAWYYGRTIRPMLVIGMAAAITASWNPIYIWADIGWYLSFLAFFGVLIVAPTIKRRVLGDKPQKFIGQVVLESLSAQIMAAPLIMYIFGQVSIIAMLSNVIIVPMVPFAMMFSVLAGLAGMLAPVISGWLAWPANMIMTYMLDLVAIFSKIPRALVETGLSLGGLLVMYGLIIFLVIVTQAKLRQRYGTITEKNIIE